MPHIYNEVFTLEKLLDKEEYNTIEDILSEIKEVKQDLSNLSSINDKLEDFKRCLLIIHEENKELKDNLSIVLKKNEEFELKLIELEKNTLKETLNHVQHIDRSFIKWNCVFVALFIFWIISWIIEKLYEKYRFSFNNLKKEEK